MTPLQLRRGTVLLSLTIILLSGCTNTERGTKHTTWRTYGGSADQSKFFIQDQLTKENVAQLEPTWIYPTGDDRSYNMNPIIVDSVMYVFAKDNSIVALDATTGKELWIHARLNGIERRGLSYWESKDRSMRRLFFSVNNSLQAIDAFTGLSVTDFGKEGVVDLREDLGRDPLRIMRASSHTPGVIYDDLIIMGASPGEGYLSPPGFIRAYNVITGERVWTFRTIPQPGEFGYETWPEDAYKYIGGVNCWGEMSVDEELGIVYVPLGSATYDYYGADRIGANLFANCLVALDAKTGERIWHYQTVHHDLWDYDLSAAPQLITVNKEGKKIDAVAVASKQGFLFVFDRKTGEPVWPIEERPVPASNMPGEEAWPTQPFPAKVPPFNRQVVTEDDVSEIFLSEEEVAQWKERIAKAAKGLFTPPDTSETIAMPGAVGGANWGNTASWPDRGLVFVMSQDYPSFYQLRKGGGSFAPRGGSPDRVQSLEAIQRGRIAYIQNCQSCHGRDLTGTALGPSLAQVAGQLDLTLLTRNIQFGTGRMPAIPNVSEEMIPNILAFLKSESAAMTNQPSQEPMIAGPVVATGGAPAARDLISIRGGTDYPEGVNVPAERYFTGYGLGYSYVVKPPWTSIVAYDLNKGEIKWRRPLGEDPEAVAKGYRDTGVPHGSQRNGMVVTSSGIVFATVANGQIYAYDVDNGEILWRGQTEKGIGTFPSMYEWNGRVYLVVSASMPIESGWGSSESDAGSGDHGEVAEGAAEKAIGAYYVYALPDVGR